MEGYTTISVLKDTSLRLKRIKSLYNMPTLDYAIRVLMYSHYVIMCREFMTVIRGKAFISQSELETLLERYPECDPFFIGLLQKVESKNTVKYHVNARSIEDLIEPLKEYVQIARHVKKREKIRAMFRSMGVII